MNIEQKYLSSREVAEMVGKDHNKLMRDIRVYIEQLGESKIGRTDFFKESTYRTSQNKEQPCYLVTKCIPQTPTDGFAEQNGRDAERAD